MATIEVPHKVGDQVWAVNRSGYRAHAEIECPNCGGEGRIPISISTRSFLKCKRCDGEKTISVNGGYKSTVDQSVICSIEITIRESGTDIVYCVGCRHMMMHRESTRLVFDTEAEANRNAEELNAAVNAALQQKVAEASQPIEIEYVSERE